VAARVYGIPPEQATGKPVLMRLRELNFNNDKEGRPVAINLHIGSRPVMAFGNSEGDLQMLQWTAAGDGPRFGLYVHHTDVEREWAYDRQSSIDGLDRGLDEAKAKVISRPRENDSNNSSARLD
jgi:hypothetical protein